MAGEGGGPGAGGDVIFIVVIIIVIASFWFLAGGPERSDVSLLIRPPSSPQIGETVTEGDDSSVRSDVIGITSEIKKVEDAITTLKKIPSSSQRGKVDIYSVSQAEETKPEQEYIVLKANKDSECPLPKNETTDAGSQALGNPCNDELENTQRCRIEPYPPATHSESCRACSA